MTFKDQLKQSRIKFRNSCTTQEFDVQYGEGESATTITFSVVVSKLGVLEDRCIRDIKLYMSFVRARNVVLGKHRDLTPSRLDSIELYVDDNVWRLGQHQWWLFSSVLMHTVEDCAAYNDAIRGRFDPEGDNGDDSLRQYALEKVTELLDAIDGLVNEWLANNKE
ncbi:MAG: hypothetical protein SOR95_08205 [Sutterella sp.]|nr:hypothetical protein [Sutterella sp.]